MVFERILVLVDSSKPSEKALDYAGEIAKLAGSKVFILRVIERMAPVEQKVSKVHLQGIVNEIQDYLNEEKRKLESIGVNVETMYDLGNIESKIEEYCEEIKPDLVVTGHKKKTKVMEYLTESVAHMAITDSPCPVMVVK